MRTADGLGCVGWGADSAPGTTHPTGERLALDFFAAWGDSFDACWSSFHDLLSDDCVWDQRPVPKLRGPRQAVRFLKIARATLGLDTIDVEILHVASSGNTIHVERVDRLRRRDGSLIAAPPVVGVMTFSGDRVVHWREYFDSAEFVAQALGTSLLQAGRRLRGAYAGVIGRSISTPPAVTPSASGMSTRSTSSKPNAR